MRGLFVPCVVVGAALAAGLALVSPIALVWADGTSVLQAELLLQNMPEASAAGAMTAVMVAVVIGALGIPVLSWLAVVCGLAGVMVDHVAAGALTPAPALTTLDYADGLWGGVILGGLAAVPARPGVRIAFVLGAVASIVGGTLTETPLSYRAPRPTASQSWPFLGSPPLWLVGPLLILAVVAGFVIGKRRTATLLAPVCVAVIAAAVAGAEALGHGGDGVRIAAALALACTAGCLFAVAGSIDGRNLVVATALLFVPSVVIAMRGRDFGRAVYSPQWLQFSGGVHACAPCLAAAAIAAGCAVGVYLRRKCRPDHPIRSIETPVTTVRSNLDLNR